MEIKNVKLSELKSNPNNPRIIKDDKFIKLVNSIKEFPKMLEIRPIVVNADMIVLGGNMRLKACKEAGLKEVPVIFAHDLTEDEQKQFIIKDNVGFGEWDWDMLANEWDAEDLVEWGLDVPIFDAEDLGSAEEDNHEMPESIETDIVIGDLFEIGEHRLLCGDSTNPEDINKLFNGKKADLILTDPPYGIGYEYDKHKDDDNEKNANLVSDVFNLHQCGKVWTPGLMNLTRDIERFGKTKVAVWFKKFAAAGNGVGGASTWEPILILNPPEKKLKNDVIELMVEKEELHGKSLREFHSCPKPVKLYGILVNSFTSKNHLIFEPFCGSGTTLIASHQMERTCYAMEFSEKYCQVIVDRMIKLDPTLTIKRNGEIWQTNKI
jgi:DNA modification methylase